MFDQQAPGLKLTKKSSVSVTTTTGAADAATSLGELVYFPVHAKGLQLALIAEVGT